MSLVSNAVNAVSNVGSNIAKAVTNILTPKPSTPSNTPVTTQPKSSSTPTISQPVTVAKPVTATSPPTSGDLIRAARAGANVTITPGGSTLITQPKSSSSSGSGRSSSSSSVTVSEPKVSTPSIAENIFNAPVYGGGTTAQVIQPKVSVPVSSTNIAALAPVSIFEKTPTPRLSGLPSGVPSTPRMPGETSGMSSYKDYMDVTTKTSKDLGLSKPVINTTPQTVSDIFSGKAYGIDIIKPGVPLTVTSGKQSFSGRINTQEGIAQVEQLQKDVAPKVTKYNEITTNELNPTTTNLVKNLNSVLNEEGKSLDTKGADLVRESDIFNQRLASLNKNSQSDVDRYNNDLKIYKDEIAQYNKDLDTYKKQSEQYSPIIENYNKNVQEASKLYNDIVTTNVMAKDITGNINLSLVPAAIKAPVGPVAQRYGPGGIFEHKFLSWEGQGERLANVGGVYKVGLTGKGGIDVNPAAVHNPFIRDVLKVTAEHPLLAAAAGAEIYAVAPVLATSLATGLGVSTGVSEGYNALASGGKISFISGQKEPLFSQRYTPAMDIEARRVLEGNIPQATLLPPGFGGRAGGVWAPGKWVTEGINLGLMSSSRLQKGVNALYDYYKQQGLSDQEAEFRVLKAQDSLKISNQREWVDLAAAGVVTNYLGEKGVAFAEEKIAPTITRGIPFLEGASKIPIIGNTFLGKALSEGATTPGARYLATRVLGMAPAGALEGIYFTGAQQGGRYYGEMTPGDYARGGIIGAVSAPMAQMFIEKNYIKTLAGGAIDPRAEWVQLFGKDLSKPTRVDIPTLRETALFTTDPLEPVSDALTKMTAGIRSNTKVTTSPFGNIFSNTGDTWGLSDNWAYANARMTPTVQNPMSIVPYQGVNTLDTQIGVRQPSVFTNTNVQPYTFTNVQPYTEQNVRALTNTNILPMVNTQVVPYSDVFPLVNVNVNPDVNPLVNVNPNVNINPYVNTNPDVNPLVNVNPNVNPEVNPEVNPNVNVNSRFPFAAGWLGSLGGSTGSTRTGRGVNEWIVGNKIATYGEDWFAKQQQKASAAEYAFKGQQQFRLAPQGVQVVNRIMPQQHFKMPQMSKPQFNIPQQQFYKVETQQKLTETPRQHAQRAVENGFGKIKTLTVEKIRGNSKALKHNPDRIKGWK